MFRNIMNDLATWYEVGSNKAALIRGCKGVGKTWAAADFATGFFDEHIIIDFAIYHDLVYYLSKERKPDRMHAKITTAIDKYDFTGKLLIFDNVQLCTQAIYNLTEYAKYNSSFRVIMIATIQGAFREERLCGDDLYVYEMFPMTFDEFLKAGKGRKLCQFIENQRIQSIPTTVRQSIDTMLNAFMLTGGMPEAVNAYYKNEDFAEVDAVLEDILSRMVDYVAEVAPRRLLKKAMMVWHSIPDQLTKENKKFSYSTIDPQARFREFGESVQFLVRIGVLRQVYRVKHGRLPLISQKHDRAFEIFHLDHGLLRVMSGIAATDVPESEILDIMDGVLAEQYALNELCANKNIGELYFWISSATAKVDFVYEGDGEVVPVDVQTNPRTKAQSVKVFKRSYGNATTIRISTDDMFVEGGLVNVPLYGIWNF